MGQVFRVLAKKSAGGFTNEHFFANVIACVRLFFWRTKGGYNNESQTFGEKDLREMQNHQAQGARDGNLREPEAQTAAGLNFIVGR